MTGDPLAAIREALAVPDEFVGAGPYRHTVDAALAALAQVEQLVEAADRYLNWHEPRVIPTEDVRDIAQALAALRAALLPFGQPTTGDAA